MMGVSEGMALAAEARSPMWYCWGSIVVVVVLKKVWGRYVVFVLWGRVGVSQWCQRDCDGDDGI